MLQYLIHANNGIIYISDSLQLLTVPKITDYKKMILKKLLEHGFVGARHTSEDNIPKGFNPNEHKVVLKAYKEIKKEGLLILKPKPDGIHISINPRTLHRVREILEEG